MTAFHAAFETALDGLFDDLWPHLQPDDRTLGAIAVYRGAMFPEWDGNLIVAALKYQLVARLERDEGGAIVSEERLFDGEFGRIRDVVVAPDGALLLLTDEANGALLRVSRDDTAD